MSNAQGEAQGHSPSLKTKEANPCRLEPVVMGGVYETNKG